MRLAALLVLLAAAPTAAQDAGVPAAMQIAWEDVAPHVDASRGVVATVALGVAGEHRGPLSARRLWARREAESRARAALHAWADAAIAHAAIPSATIAALHAAIDAHATTSATRARVDGSACVEVVVALSDLAASTPGQRGLPWSG